MAGQDSHKIKKFGLENRTNNSCIIISTAAYILFYLLFILCVAPCVCLDVLFVCVDMLCVRTHTHCPLLSRGRETVEDAGTPPPPTPPSLTSSLPPFIFLLFANHARFFFPSDSGAKTAQTGTNHTKQSPSPKLSKRGWHVPRDVLHPRQPLLNCDYMSVEQRRPRCVAGAAQSTLLRPVPVRHTDTPLDFLPLFQRSIFKGGDDLLFCTGGGGK